jgi:DNA-binding GntR family transcriptional regulator
VEHQAIFDAVKAHDAELAVRRLVTHLSHIVFHVVEMVDPSYRPDRIEELLVRMVGEARPP